MKSLSEIETTSKRASRAVGFSWGIAEEIAKGIRLLELFGLPGIKNLNLYYRYINKKKFDNLSIIIKNNKLNKLALCPINLGINFLDQIKTLEPFKKITFQKIAYPLLFLPFLSRSSELVGKKILFKFEKNNFLLNFNVNILSNFSKKDFPLIAKKVEISFLENKDSFSEKDWKNLYKLSENTFVEETESLKQGAAGAGLTDND
tara:strand:+ start:4946 stop:5557 length:612 start_codon:yes stop_codon:yes gene_type:complete